MFESGKLQPDGSIVGNDNDADPRRFEAHYDRIASGDDVQIYGSVMVDEPGRVTTGLLQAVRYAKDNRLLPRGFDKATALADISVHGEAMQDTDFAGGGDRITYVIALAGAQQPLTVSAQLLFQTIGFRWAQNFKPYDASETRRFVEYEPGHRRRFGRAIGIRPYKHRNAARLINRSELSSTDCPSARDRHR